VMDERGYYERQWKRLVKNHWKMMELGRPILAGRYGDEVALAAVEGSAVEFEGLIPEIPYIGGQENPLTDTLVQMTSMLALYRVLKAHDKPVTEIGEIVYEMGQRWTEQLPAFARQLIGRLYMSQFWRRRTRRKAAVSQQRDFLDNFVFEVVEGGGEAFEWGINYMECGVVKFFERQQAAELSPYMCQLDFLMFQALGLKLQRQGTIAQGCSHCDFRFGNHR
jgi:hypothetical protein